MKIFSGAFEDNQPIPSKYTCEGEDVSPPLNWSNIPENAKSLVLIVEDPDAPDPKAPKMVWFHWILYNIDPKSTGLIENVQLTSLPPKTETGTNSWNKNTYGGPCPPIGEHRYFHRLYALDINLTNIQKPDAATLRQVMRDHIISEACLMGTYIKQKS